MKRKHVKAKPEQDPKSRILDVALKEFAAYGIEGARVDRIANNASINKAMIYYYFSSKENLYLAVLKRNLEGMFAMLSRHLTEHLSLEETLAAFVEVYHTLFIKQPEFPRLILRELATPKSSVIPRLAKSINASQFPHRIGKLIQEGIDSGQLRAVNVQQAIVSFITMNLGYFFLSPITDRVLGVKNRKQFIVDRKTAIVDLFLYGVKTR